MGRPTVTQGEGWKFSWRVTGEPDPGSLTWEALPGYEVEEDLLDHPRPSMSAGVGWITSGMPLGWTATRVAALLVVAASLAGSMPMRRLRSSGGRASPVVAPRV